MSTMTEISGLITSNPSIRCGRPIIAGTGVTVNRIVGWYQLGLSPEEIVREIPHLTLAQIYAALAFYHANRNEIDVAMAAEDAEAEQLEMAARESRGKTLS